MAKWIYDGYTKEHDDSRKHIIEKWYYKCSECGGVVTTAPRPQEIRNYTKCPNCGAVMGNED